MDLIIYQTESGEWVVYYDPTERDGLTTITKGPVRRSAGSTRAEALGNFLLDHGDQINIQIDDYAEGDLVYVYPTKNYGMVPKELYYVEKLHGRELRFERKHQAQPVTVEEALNLQAEYSVYGLLFERAKPKDA